MEIEAVVEDGSGLTLSSLNGPEVEISDCMKQKLL